MNLLSPLALLWLLGVPVLVWLWRLASTRRQVKVPSLVPFEHLLARPPRRATRLVVNLLFWLQLATLIGVAMTLAQPVLIKPRARTILVVVDTSASMGAHLKGGVVFEQAQHALRRWLLQKASTDQVLLMTTAPVKALTTQPTSDAIVLNQLIETLRVADLDGNLSTTVRIGRALLGADPDQIVVITDEPPPAQPQDRVRFITVGGSGANVAIVGLDAQAPLCGQHESRIMVVAQNFSPEVAPVTLSAFSQSAQVAQMTAELPSDGRHTFSLTIPPEVEGWVEVRLSAPHDSLEVDHHAWVDLQRHAPLPVVVHAQTPAFLQTMSDWLTACEGLVWSSDQPPNTSAYLLITDHQEPFPSAGGGMMRFYPPAQRDPIRTYWVVSSAHPIGLYLSPIEVVAGSLMLTEGAGGVPVVSAFVDGHNVPIILAAEGSDGRIVSMRIDPSEYRHEPLVLLTFFNSLKWLMTTSQAMVMTGEPILFESYCAAKNATVHRPDGGVDQVEISHGAVRYDQTTMAGRYRLVCGTVPIEETRAVQFIDPVESDLRHRVSTWSERFAPALTDHTKTSAPHPLAHLLLIIVLVALMAEWWLYSMRKKHRFPGNA